MYSVNQKYIDKINSDSHKDFTFKLNVKLNKDATTLLTLTPADVESDSLKLSRQATSNSYFTLGGVCSSKLTMALTPSGVDRLLEAGLLRKDICFEYNEWLKVDDVNQSDSDYSINTDGTENTTGKVKNGYFYVNKVENSDYSCNLELYDSMLAFSTDISYNDGIILTQGYRSILDLFTLFCKSCSTDLYKLTVASDIESRIYNKEVLFSVGNDGSVDSYRNALGYLSILAGGFVVINRNGELDLVNYNNTVVASLDENRVYDYSMSEVEYEVNEISTSVAGFDYSVKNKTSASENLIKLFFSENPFLRGIQTADAKELDSLVKSCINNMLLSCQGIKFDGGDFEIDHRPELDLGDCIQFTKAYVDNKTKNILTKTYNNAILCNIESSFNTFDSMSCNKYDLESAYGSKSSSSFKTSSGGSSALVSSYYTQFLTKDVSVGAGKEVKLFNSLILLNSGIGAMASFVAVCNITGVGNIQFNIVYDNVAHPIKPRYTLHNEGYFTVSFDIGLDPVDEDMQHSLNIYVKSLDTATLNIATLDSELIINASGVKSAEPTWTGRYELSDSVNAISLPNVINVLNFTSNIEFTDKTPEPPATGSIDVKLMPASATLKGSATLRNNANVEGGKDIDRLDTYPNNTASWTFKADGTISNAEIQVSAAGLPRYLDIYLDDVRIVQKLEFNSEDYTHPVLVSAGKFNISAGNHTLTIANGKGNWGPIVAYVSIKG